MKNNMMMRVKDYVNKYIGDDYKKFGIEIANDGEFIDSYQQKVIIKINGELKEMKISELWITLGFKKEYSISERFSKISKEWSDYNILPPDKVFYQADMNFIINTNNGYKLINPYYYDETIGLVDENNLYDFKNEDYITLRLDDLEKRNKFTIYKEDVIREYRRIVNTFFYKEQNGNNILNIDENSIKLYRNNFKISGNLNKKRLVNIYKDIIDIVGVDLPFEIITLEYLNQKAGESIYYTKKEILSFIDSIELPNEKFIFYAIFSGMGKNNYETLSNLELRHIDKEKKKVYYGGEEYDVDDTFIELAEKADKLYRYELIGDRVNVYTFDPDSPYIIKKVARSYNVDSVSPCSTSKLRAMIASINKKIGIGAKGKTNIEVSGVIYRLKEYIKNNNIKNIESFVRKGEYESLARKTISSAEMLYWLDRLYGDEIDIKK